MPLRQKSGILALQMRTNASELSLIQQIRLRTGVAGGEIRLGIGDDCALLRPRAGEEIAITTDFSLENVHFRLDWHPPQSVGHRSLARGLSDLAAMGARPIGALLSLALPAELTVAEQGGRSWAELFLDGFLALAGAFKVPLIGGDTAQSASTDHAGSAQSGVAADVVLLGGVKRGCALRRSGARPGDLIYVTGALGGAAAELLSLGREPDCFRHLTAAPAAGTGSTRRFGHAAESASAHPHLYPEPRVAVGRKLVGLATAAIDLSDGISADLRHICEESGLSAVIQNLLVHPLAIEAESGGWTPSALKLALDGGEDYELLFTAAPQTTIPKALAGVAIHAIGEMRRRGRGRPMIQLGVETGRGRTRLVPVEPGGWEHFRHGAGPP
jgi:thiamine-monophosphate kinase